jgi:hypothetical protein
MKIYTIGDSHADFSFREIISIDENRNNIGPITMHRVRRDKMDFFKIFQERNIDVSVDSFVIFSFGEIDMRCHIYNQVNIENAQEGEVIYSLINEYTDHIKSQNSFFKKIGILSITPPGCIDWSASNAEYPFLGSDQERSRYTLKSNNILKEMCLQKNISFIDVYDAYSDEKGMLLQHLSDGSVHIGNTTYVSEELKKHFII